MPIQLPKSGSGSGIDADRLDGKDSTFYLDIESRLGFPPLNKANGEMLNQLIAVHNPITNPEIATKKYVDDQASTIPTSKCKPAIAWFNEGTLIGAGGCINFVGTAVNVTFDENTEIATVMLGDSDFSLIVEHNDVEISAEVTQFDFINENNDVVVTTTPPTDSRVNIEVYNNQIDPAAVTSYTAIQYGKFKSHNFLSSNPNLAEGQNFVHTYTYSGSGTQNVLVHYPKHVSGYKSGLTYNLLLLFASTPTGTVNVWLDENASSPTVTYSSGGYVTSQLKPKVISSMRLIGYDFSGNKLFNIQPETTAPTTKVVTVTIPTHSALLISGILVPSIVFGDDPKYSYSTRLY